MLLSLKMWEEKHSTKATRHAHSRIVPDNCPGRSELYGLVDYVVSAVDAGSVWLMPRRPLSASQRNIRQHLRNFCVGLDQKDVAQMLDQKRDSFAGDCIHEFLLEMIAEQR